MKSILSIIVCLEVIIRDVLKLIMTRWNTISWLEFMPSFNRPFEAPPITAVMCHVLRSVVQTEIINLGQFLTSRILSSTLWFNDRLRVSSNRMIIVWNTNWIRNFSTFSFLRDEWRVHAFPAIIADDKLQEYGAVNWNVILLTKTCVSRDSSTLFLSTASRASSASATEHRAIYLLRWVSRSAEECYN